MIRDPYSERPKADATARVALAEYEQRLRWEHRDLDESDAAEAEAVAAAAEAQRWALAGDVFKALGAHFFSAGPQPEEVMQRVFAAAAARRPDLLDGMSKREIRLACEETPAARKWRVAALFPGEEDVRARYKAIIGQLRAAFSANRRRLPARVTLNDALTVAGGVETALASETLSRVLGRIFFEGCDPRAVVQHTFALFGWLGRDMQLNMSFEALGQLFDEQRATQSWRSKKVEKLLRDAGFRGVNTGWQKPAGAVEKFRQSAKGNRNRSKPKRVRNRAGIFFKPSTSTNTTQNQ
jgi:hypothetical protein